MSTRCSARPTPGALHASAACLAFMMVASSCDDPARPLRPDQGGSLLIEDGNNNGGNAHFYWLRPMVTPPASFSGTFDPTVKAEIKICALTTEGTACDGGDIAVFSMTTGDGSEIIRVEPDDEHYVVNWHTGRHDLDPMKIYRIRVYVDRYLLGVADVEIGSTMDEVKNVNTSEYIGLLDGKTLPIKFRIEEGAVPKEELGVIAAGATHACALDTGGNAYCWGDNVLGQLGTATWANSPSPVPVETDLTFSEIVAGAFHTCGLATDGSAHCWGKGETGNLGNGSFANVNAPVAVAGGHTFTALSATAFHTCGLKADGTALCWGNNEYFQLGIGFAHGYFSTPQAVTGGHTFAQLSAGFFHTCGIRRSADPALDGTALCWGANRWGQLGNGTTDGHVWTPAPVSGMAQFASIDAGHVQTCALTSAGAAYCWGYNGNGSLGIGSLLPEYVTAPAAVVGGHAFRALTTGDYHTCGIVSSSGPALDTRGYCWGWNPFGQTGTGSTAVALVAPTAVSGVEQFAALDGGWQFTCGVTISGEGRCWGINSDGQLGTGTVGGTSRTPVSVTGGLTFATP